jgi:hypothetical protein
MKGTRARIRGIIEQQMHAMDPAEKHMALDAWSLLDA